MKYLSWLTDVMILFVVIHDSDTEHFPTVYVFKFIKLLSVNRGSRALANFFTFGSYFRQLLIL